ncbi:MAG: ATP-binding protein [Terracidiphilus sp.]|jgi:two-component system sensor histidine kinase KdpD
MSESLEFVRPTRAKTHGEKAKSQAEQFRSSVLDGLAQAYKTPLTAILAASAGLIEMGRLSDTQADLIALIDDQARLLSNLTTRLLATARLDAREIEIHPKPVGVEPIIDDAVAAFRPRLANKKLVIDLENDNLVLNCDRQLILMLLNQYIDNACKYSNAGTAITIRVVDENSKVIFSVHNFGPMIPLEELEGIFDHYSLPSSFAGRTAGKGFGLSVAKRIASFHGGEVWATSTDEGTTFFAAIPTIKQRRYPR